MLTATTRTPDATGTARFEVLLDRRIELGCTITALWCHPQTHRHAEALLVDLERLEAALARFRRYATPAIQDRIFTAEEACWHSPAHLGGPVPELAPQLGQCWACLALSAGLPIEASAPVVALAARARRPRRSRSPRRVGTTVRVPA